MQFPPMPSCNGCGDCCGIVTCTEQEAKVIQGYLKEQGTSWHPSEGITCGFLDADTKQCRIYPVRPTLCHAFGVVTQLPCPHFPEDARINFPVQFMQQLALVGPEDHILAYYFAPDPEKEIAKAKAYLIKDWLRSKIW